MLGTKKETEEIKVLDFYLFVTTWCKAHVQYFLPENWLSLTPGPAPNEDVLIKVVPLDPALLNPVDPANPVRPSRMELLEPVLPSAAVPCPVLPSPVSCGPDGHWIEVDLGGENCPKAVFCVACKEKMNSLKSFAV